MRLTNVLFIALSLTLLGAQSARAELMPSRLRVEYREDPLGIDEPKPRMQWIVASEERGQQQRAYQILVASTPELLDQGLGDLWDSGRVLSSDTIQVVYEGQPLASRQRCYWKVRVWDQENRLSAWSEAAFWSMGLLKESDWTADYISYRDGTPVFKDRDQLYLPPASHYRKDFVTSRKLKHATVYATALGIYELQINGQRVCDAFFAPGWTDYHQRAYYNVYDVTELLREGENAIGAVVAEGWYSGYVGFGLLVGIGTERIGRYTYGKTPALMAQLELEYEDGSREVIGTGTDWRVTNEGPIREADLLMGEAYDARLEFAGWSSVGFDDSGWQSAILASENGQAAATFYEFQNPKQGGGPRIQGRPVELGFKRPRLEAFPGVPVRVTEEIEPTSVTIRDDGSTLFNLGQNFAGTIRLKVQGDRGDQLTIRYGEMLHPDGRLMTENLRKARATDTYICKGDPDGEVFVPRFTFHGFQYVEVTGLTSDATKETVTGLVLHSDTPMVSEFACSDPMADQLFRNILWTQRANFIDLPTDCPQRDERMGWTGDAQAYVGAAAYNADISAFFTKWNRELMESQRPGGAFPGYAPYPFQHGWDFGSAWADAGVICPWTIWKRYGDTRIIERSWESMTRFMQWRQQTSVDDLGVAHGNAWGDWLAQGEVTPLEYVDTVFLAISSKMMGEMASAIGKDDTASAYRKQFRRTKAAFARKYLQEDGCIRVPTQTAHALALQADLVPNTLRRSTAKRLAAMIAENGNHMATGFLGTKPLLPVLSDAGQHDLATFLFQSREFPSWGYEVEQGATSIWERWDSYTREDGFGRHNAAMNSFSHYAFGAVCEWMFSTLAGIRNDRNAFQEITIHPKPPTPGSNAQHDPIHWVEAAYDSIRGRISSRWKVEGNRFHLHVEIPANTVATVVMPTRDVASLLENQRPLGENPYVRFIRSVDKSVELVVQSGAYQFECEHQMGRVDEPLRTSQPPDRSINPDAIDLVDAELIQRWDFSREEEAAAWEYRKSVDVVRRDAGVFLVATGQDSQLATHLDQPVAGRLVLEVRAMPEKGATAQFYWSGPDHGYREQPQLRRLLSPTEKINAYLFQVPRGGPLDQLRFDPFATFDPYADRGEMQIESISIYRLPDST